MAAIRAAVELDLFTEIAKGNAIADDLALAAGAAARGIRTFRAGIAPRRECVRCLDLVLLANFLHQLERGPVIPTLLGNVRISDARFDAAG